MKRITLTLSLLFLGVAGAFAQMESPVTWAYFAKKVSATEAVVYLKASIEDRWHLYSQNLKPNGPNPTKITFKPSNDFTLVGKTTEPKATSYYDKIFKMDIGYFADEVIFTQKIKLKKGTTTVKGMVEFTVCDDKSCLPPAEVAFSIPVK